MGIDGLWRATGLTGEAALLPILAGSAITMEIIGDRVSGHSGVNRYFGGLVDGVLGPMASSMMAGPPDLMEQESHYLELLTGSTPVLTGENSMVLMLEGEGVAVFELVVPELAGIRWVLSGFNNGTGGFASVVAGTEVTAEFDDEGRVVGSGGCNNYRASFEVAVNSITIGPPMATRMACPDERIGEQEVRYFALLEMATSFRFSDQRGETSLEMFDVDDTRILSFVVGDIVGDGPGTDVVDQNV